MSNTFINYIETSKSHVSRLILFDRIKTGDPVIDTFLITFILGLFSWVVSWIYDNNIESLFSNLSFDDIKNIFFKKNTIIIEGCRSSTTSSYSNSYNISSAYSNRFKAIWEYIINNIDKNNTIYKIKENHTNFQTSIKSDESRRKNIDLFMVFQNKHFYIDKDIYFKANIEHDSDKNEKEKVSIKIDKITIYIYSYKLSLSELIEYVDKITLNYLASIKENRINKQFIYTVNKSEIKEDETLVDCWREDFFESARTFNNIFFDGKKQLIDKIDFFLNNKNWYYDKGIPYSLGIGLHGPPGTGKTSFIKALANYTNRHVIIISLKIIKTKKQLEHFFFENKYNNNNEYNSISWDKKILVFEDIDCIGDIVLNRENKDKRSKKIKDAKININNDTVNVSNVIETICGLNEISTVTNQKEQLITLDDILNLWDGIIETPGRILIISSNHYNKLDPALVRPGRIDITHELSNASHNTISEIYSHLFNSKIDDKKLTKIKNYFYSPAEIINIYVSNKDEKSFLKRLSENKKIN
jgi:chaperone BCS1